MPYRDELDALRAQVEALTMERDEAIAGLERARAALASVVADMAGLPAEADIPWRSLHGGEPIAVRFVNATDRKVELVWLRYDGRARSELTLIPEGAREVRTSVAHLYRVLDPASGEVLRQGYVRADEPRVVIA
jgi:hypothetical protein